MNVHTELYQFSSQLLFFPLCILFHFYLYVDTASYQLMFPRFPFTIPLIKKMFCETSEAPRPFQCQFGTPGLSGQHMD